MTIQPCNAHDVIEFEDGEQMFREEWEKLAISKDETGQYVLNQRVIPVADPLYEQTVRYMLERRGPALPKLPTLNYRSLEVGDHLA